MTLRVRAALASTQWQSRSATRIRRRNLTLSTVEGAKHPALDERTFPTYFAQEILAKHSERPALISPREPPRAHGGPRLRNLGVEGHLAWDFDEFDRHIQALARGLVDLGVKKGDRVAVLMGNNSAYAMLQWACASIGAILVTVNPAYRVHELINVLNLVSVSHLFVVPSIRTSRYLDLLSAALPSLRNAAPGNIQEEQLPSLRSIFVIDNLPDSRRFSEALDTVRCAVDFRELLIWREGNSEARAVAEMSQALDKDEVINLQFTSGTTGLPKAVSLTHSNLLNNAISIGGAMRFTHTDIACNVPPLFHCVDKSPSPLPFLPARPRSHARLVAGNLSAWVYGAAVVYASETYDPAAIVDALLGQRCTALHGVPTHFMGVLAEVERRRKAGAVLDFSRLRTGVASGSPVPMQLLKQLITEMNLRELTNAYGMTETSPISFQTVPEDPLIKRVETVGRVRPHVKAKIVDDEGNIVPVGTSGELLVSGYLVHKGYWNDEEQTKMVVKKTPGGDDAKWMHTGDKVALDEEGYLSIVSRIKDIIIRGGENLFPVQIENLLMSNPAVLEAAVVAIPDARYGEVVGAWIVPRPNTSLTREQVRKAVYEGMNPQNAPKWVWFLGEHGTQGELPRTPSGKVQKHILREWSRTLAEKGVGLVST